MKTFLLCAAIGMLLGMIYLLSRQLWRSLDPAAQPMFAGAGLLLLVLLVVLTIVWLVTTVRDR